MPAEELDAFFSIQEIELILGKFRLTTGFVAKKKDREKNIKVFSKLDKYGKDADE